jgi:hypothetical protein
MTNGNQVPDNSATWSKSANTPTPIKHQYHEQPRL